ncbi:MAG: DUF2095 family protein, partial [Candidatus Odinarchaeota archaeon]
QNKNRKSNKKIRVEDKEGLTVSYNKEELDSLFPYLTKEISEKKKSMKIDSFDDEIEKNFEGKPQKTNESYPNELYNPGTVDFIRRCTTKDEAIEILDYLLKRNEITNEDYSKFKNIIIQEKGLLKFINESGGLKRPGYYMRKYYREISDNQKLNNSID